MKIAFFGTPSFAVPALDRLFQSRYEVALIVTQPDRPKGRGQKIESSAVKQWALEHAPKTFPPPAILQPTRLKDEPQVAQMIKALEIDLVVVAAFGQILPRTLLDAPRLGCINIHPSLLPKYRGAAPIQRCLLDGEAITGVSLMMLVEALDAGPIVAQQSVEIFEDDDAQSLSDMLAVTGAEMLIRVLDEVQRQKSDKIECVEQEHALATYAPPLKKEEGLIPWGDSTQRIIYRLRAMTPWPGAYTFVNGTFRLGIIQGEPLWSNEVERLVGVHEARPGIVTSLMKGFGFTVRTGDGHILLTAVQPQGKRAMPAEAYIAGRNIQVGDALGIASVGSDVSNNDD